MMKTLLKNIYKKINTFLLKLGLVKIDVEPTSKLLKLIKKVYGILFKLYLDHGKIALSAFKENDIILTKTYVHSQIPNSCIDNETIILFTYLRSNWYAYHNEYIKYDIEHMFRDIESLILLNSYGDSHEYCTKDDSISFSIPQGKSENEIMIKIKLTQY